MPNYLIATWSDLQILQTTLKKDLACLKAHRNLVRKVANPVLPKAWHRKSRTAIRETSTPTRGPSSRALLEAIEPETKILTIPMRHEPTKLTLLVTKPRRQIPTDILGTLTLVWIDRMV